MQSHFFGKTRKGFTLLELLIVIAVVGGLAAMAINTFPGATRRARDSTRKSDIKQYQTAMETYYNKNGVYVDSSGTVNLNTYCSSNLSLPTCPNDPKGTSPYRINSSTSNYVMWAQLEQPISGSTGYFVVCSDGRSGECSTAPSSSTCGGGCP